MLTSLDVKAQKCNNKKRLNTQQLEDVFGDAFLVSHYQERQLLCLITTLCMFSSSLASITNIIFCIPTGDLLFNP